MQTFSPYKFSMPGEQSPEVESLVGFFSRTKNTLSSPYPGEGSSSEFIITKQHLKLTILLSAKAPTDQAPCDAFVKKGEVVKALTPNSKLFLASTIFLTPTTAALADQWNSLLKSLKMLPVAEASKAKHVNFRISCVDDDFFGVVHSVLRTVFQGMAVSLHCHNPNMAPSLFIFHEVLSSLSGFAKNVRITFMNPLEILMPRSMGIVFDEADVSAAADYILDSLLYFRGRTTLRLGIVLVQENVWQQFGAEISDNAAKRDLPAELTTEEEKEFISRVLDNGGKEVVSKGVHVVKAHTKYLSGRSRLPSWPLCCLVPFRTAKDAVNWANVIRNSQRMLANRLDPYYGTKSVLSMFTMEHNLFWQVAGSLSHFTAFTVNGTFSQLLSSCWNNVPSAGLQPGLSSIDTPGDSIMIEERELVKLNNLVKQLEYEAKGWRSVSLEHRHATVNAVLSSVPMPKYWTERAVGGCGDDVSQTLRQSRLLRARVFRDCFGIVYLEAKEGLPAEELNKVVMAVLRDGAAVIVNQPVQMDKFSPTLKSLVQCETFSPNALQSYGVPFIRVTSGEEGTFEFSRTCEILLGIGGYLFAN